AYPIRAMAHDHTPAPAAAASTHPAPPAARGWIGRARRAIGRISEHTQHEAHHYAREAVEEAVIDLAPLPREMRFLAGAGYATLFALLVAVLATELAGGRLPGGAFHGGAGGVRGTPAGRPGAGGGSAPGGGL